MFLYLQPLQPLIPLLKPLAVSLACQLPAVSVKQQLQFHHSIPYTNSVLNILPLKKKYKNAFLLLSNFLHYFLHCFLVKQFFVASLFLISIILSLYSHVFSCFKSLIRNKFILELQITWQPLMVSLKLYISMSLKVRR